MKILPCILALFHLLGSSLIAADKPNIIMILADDVGLGNLGCTGGPFKTPHLDALAKGGTQFSHCFAMPQCSPSRCTLLTGRYPFRTGLLGNHDREDVLPKNEAMFSTVLKQAGYVTASVGKWHVGPLGPREWGFDESFLFPGSGLYWRAKKAQSKRYQINGKEHDLPEGQYLPDRLHEAKHKGIDLAPKTIPPEVFDKRAVEKGQVRFHDVAYIEVTPRFDKKNKLAVAVELTDFSVYYS